MGGGAIIETLFSFSSSFLLCFLVAPVLAASAKVTPALVWVLAKLVRSLHIVLIELVAAVGSMKIRVLVNVHMLRSLWTDILSQLAAMLLLQMQMDLRRGVGRR